MANDLETNIAYNLAGQMVIADYLGVEWEAARIFSEKFYKANHPEEEWYFDPLDSAGQFQATIINPLSESAKGTFRGYLAALKIIQFQSGGHMAGVMGLGEEKWKELYPSEDAFINDNLTIFKALILVYKIPKATMYQLLQDIHNYLHIPVVWNLIRNVASGLLDKGYLYPEGYEIQKGFDVPAKLPAPPSPATDLINTLIFVAFNVERLYKVDDVWLDKAANMEKYVQFLDQQVEQALQIQREK